jgi:hypothetical protein
MESSGAPLHAAVVRRAQQNRLVPAALSDQGTVAALLGAVGCAVASALARVDDRRADGCGVRLPGLGVLAAQPVSGASAALAPVFVLADSFSSSYDISKGRQIPPGALGGAQLLNFTAVCSFAAEASAHRMERSDAEALWGCVVACFGESITAQLRSCAGPHTVSLDLFPLGELCGRFHATSKGGGFCASFTFSPLFCVRAGLALPRSGAAQTQAQAAYDNRHANTPDAANWLRSVSASAMAGVGCTVKLLCN